MYYFKNFTKLLYTLKNIRKKMRKAEKKKKKP